MGILGNLLMSNDGLLTNETFWNGLTTLTGQSFSNVENIFSEGVNTLSGEDAQVNTVRAISSGVSDVVKFGFLLVFAFSLVMLISWLIKR